MPAVRVSLVRPPGRFASLSFPDGPMVGPPRALLHLAAAVRDDPRITLQIVDALAEPDPAELLRPPPVLFGLPPDEVARRAAAFGADVVGISTMANYYRRETIELVHALRGALPRAVLLLGGPDPTVDAAAYFAAAPVDGIAIGEGEGTFAELLGRLAEGRDWRDVAGIALPDRSAAPRPLLTDLEATTPDFGLVDLERYYALAARGWRSRPTYLRPGVERSVDLVTSRGCPYRCSFCVIHASMGRKFRTVPIPAVIAQLRMLVERHGVQHVHLEDDVLNLDRRRFVALLEALVAARLPLTWDTPNGVRADLLDAETVGLCRASGCVALILGVESGSQRVLDEVVDKELDLAAVVEAGRLCHEAELDALAFYIVGMPGETAAEAEQTVAFAFDLFERYGVTPLLQVWRPYVQTDLYARAEIAEADPAALHARTGIPFTQFRDRARADLDVDGLAALYDVYGRRLAQGQLARWRRAGLHVGVDADPERARASVERFLLQAPYLHAASRSARAAGEQPSGR